MTTIAPDYSTRFLKLPLSRLHVLETGNGPPLIMVPATISLLENWVTLAQFMGQWMHTSFFELPGHGESEAFRQPFSSQLVALLVEQIANELGYERFNLMGFSFGGILAMRTFMQLSHRIDRLILIAPCMGHRTLRISARRAAIMRQMNILLANPKVKAKFYELIHNPRTVSSVVRVLRKLGKLENTIPLEERLLKIGPNTISVLNAQIEEIFSTEFPTKTQKFTTPCYFAMSPFDPLLDFNVTLGTIEHHFSDVSVLRLSYPFHQPPQPFTFDELNHDFGSTVASFL